MGSSADRRKERRLAERVAAILGPVYSKKPIDAWLQLMGTAVGLAIWLWPNKTPAGVVIALVLMFVCFIHPAWNFWWIEKALWRRITAVVVVCAALYMFGRFVWPLTPWAKIMFAASGDYAVMINPTTDPLDTVGFQISFSHAEPEHKADPSLIARERATAWSENIGTLRPEMATPLGPVPSALRPNKEKPTLYQIRIYTRYENFTEWLYLSPRDQATFNEGLSVYRDKTHETLENSEDKVMRAWKNWPEWWR
jgi:hypothetical protein